MASYMCVKHAEVKYTTAIWPRHESVCEGTAASGCIVFDIHFYFSNKHTPTIYFVTYMFICIWMNDEDVLFAKNLCLHKFNIQYT